MEERIKSCIEGPLKDINMIVDSINFNGNDLNVVLDSDSVIDLDRIVEASHLINDILDKEDFIKDSYMLDISSKEKGGN